MDCKLNQSKTNMILVNVPNERNMANFPVVYNKMEG